MASNPMEDRCYVANLPWDFSKYHLLAELKAYGCKHTGRVFMMKNKTKTSVYAQQSAFVWCSNHEDALLMEQQLNGKYITADVWSWWHKPMKVEVAKTVNQSLC